MKTHYNFAFLQGLLGTTIDFSIHLNDLSFVFIKNYENVTVTLQIGLINTNKKVKSHTLFSFNITGYKIVREKICSLLDLLHA